MPRHSARAAKTIEESLMYTAPTDDMQFLIDDVLDDEYDPTWQSESSEIKTFPPQMPASSATDAWCEYE